MSDRQKRRKGSRKAVIREKYVDLLDGDKAAALVLDQMIAWQRWADDQEGNDGWFYKSCRHLAEHDLFGLYGKSHVGSKLDKLTDAGFLQRRESDSPTSAPDWHVNVRKVFDALPKGESVYGYNFEADGGSDGVHSSDTGVHSVDSPVQSVDRGVQSPDTTPAHNADAPQMSTKERDSKGGNIESSAERAPTPEQDEPNTSTDGPTDELRDLVQRKLGAKAQMLNYRLTADEFDEIAKRIRESAIPEDAYEKYVQHEADRIHSGPNLFKWPGGDKSVDRYLDNHPDVTPDVPEAKRRNSSNGRRARHWDDDLDQDLIDQIEQNQGGYKRDRNGEEVA